MPKKIGRKMRWQDIRNKLKRKGFVGCLCLVGMMAILNLLVPAIALTRKAEALACPDVKIIFARGSGEERWTDQNYLDFKSEIEGKLKLTSLHYEFEDLDYPAISVANPLTLLTTFISGGEAYEFGTSVMTGVTKLAAEVANSNCPSTKYVIGGYSQGAIVISKAIQYLDADKIIYAATFGDPKLYLPEGAGAVPAACKGENLSEYRIYVPDCRAYSGMLGGYSPYQPEGYTEKLGTWCNKGDFFCSSYLSMRDHTSYVADNIYEDASKHIFDKIAKAFDIKNTFVSLHDTVILIDSTASMAPLINDFKAEATRLAKKTLESGGRVALYDYGDIRDKQKPAKRCDFETCTLETFRIELDKIQVYGGYDLPESLLSAGLHVMKELNWNYGSTKSVVVLTDANYHNPDIDDVTFNDVVTLSKSIDPVNFYFVVPDEIMKYYTDFAAATDGQVVSTMSDLSILTDAIIARYDSLPRVEDLLDDTENLPEIAGVDFEKNSETSIRVTWSNPSGRTLVALNDYVLGVTESDFIVIENIDFEKENTVTLVPLSDTRRGTGVDLSIPSEGRGDFDVSATVPKAPNTGKR